MNHWCELMICTSALDSSPSDNSVLLKRSNSRSFRQRLISYVIPQSTTITIPEPIPQVTTANQKVKIFSQQILLLFASHLTFNLTSGECTFSKNVGSKSNIFCVVCRLWSLVVVNWTKWWNSSPLNEFIGYCCWFHCALL